MVRLPWIALALALAGNLAFVARYGGDIPRADEWKDVSVLLGDRPLTLKWLWTPHDVHRIPLPRLIRFALYRLSGRDFRAAMFFNVTVMAAAAALMLFVAGQGRAAPSRLEAFIPLLLLGPFHFQTFLWGFQVQFALSSALFLAAIAVIATIDGVPSPRTLAALATILLMEVLSGANGVALALPLMVWLAAALVSARGERGASWRLAAVGLAGAAVVVMTYPFGLVHPRVSASPGTILLTFLQFLSMGLAAVDTLWKTRVLFIVILGAFAFALLVRALFRTPQETWRASGLMACFASMALVGAFVAVGRGDVTANAGIQPRYATLAAPLICLAYFAPLLYGQASRYVVAAMLLAATLLAVLIGAVPAFAYGEFRRRQLDALQRDAELGLPLEAIAARNGSTLSDFSVEARAALGSLMAHGAWPFIGYRPDPRVHDQVVARTLVELGAATTRDLVRQDGVFRPGGPSPEIRLRLPRAVPTAAIELRYSVEAATDRLMILQLFWGRLPEGASDLPGDAQFAGFPVFRSERPRTLTALVYETIDTLRIQVDPAASRFQIHEIAVLELAPDWIP